MKRTPLKRKTPLQARTGLKRKTPIRTRKKKGKKRQRSVGGLLKDVEKVFNRYIRERAGMLFCSEIPCCSCGKVYHWQDLDAGHYIHGCAPLRFDERNVHPQCTACNRFRHGNGPGYAAYLVKRYGPDIIIELHNIRQANKATPKRWKRSELLALLDEYTRKLARLRGVK